jgi:hypothetical protein
MRLNVIKCFLCLCGDGDAVFLFNSVNMVNHTDLKRMLNQTCIGFSVTLLGIFAGVFVKDIGPRFSGKAFLWCLVSTLY